MNQRRFRVKPKSVSYPMLTRDERLRVWERARGLWKRRKQDPIAALKTMRKSWDRKFPK